MVNPPWNHENIDSWLYRRGTSNNIQSKLLVVQLSVLECTSQPESLTVKDMNKSYPWSLVKIKIIKIGMDYFSPVVLFLLKLLTQLSDLESKELIDRNLLDLSVKWISSRIKVFSKEMHISTEDKNTPALTLKI